MLRGSAFMIMWHDIAPEGEDEYHHWHSEQHMPERLDHRGFRRSRRGVNWQYDRQRYFTLYEGDDLATFVSDDYLGSLNGPTEWTSRMAPHFRNFLRSACEVRYSKGRGVGGAIASLRGVLPAGVDEDRFLASLRPELDRLIEQPKICGVHAAFARSEFSGQKTRETELRPQMAEAPFEFVVLVESFGLRELGEIVPHVSATLETVQAGGLVSQSYDMAYCLEENA